MGQELPEMDRLLKAPENMEVLQAAKGVAHEVQEVVASVCVTSHLGDNEATLEEMVL